MIIDNILEKAAFFHMQNIIKKRPLDINIETITLCPLKCVFCCNRLYKREYIIMRNDLFENIVKQYCDMGGGTIGIGSMQSDFLSDPLLMDRIKVIKKYKRKLWVHSTTPLITCKKYSDKELVWILKSIDYLCVSALGYDRESYKSMAGVDGFVVFKEQLERVNRLIKEKNLKIKIDIAFRTNRTRVLKRSEFYKEVSSMFYISDIKDTFFSWFGSIKREDLPDGAKLAVKHNDKRKENCVVPSATLAVQANGNVVGCGCIDWLEKYVVGDTNQNTLKEIWQSSKATNFRNAIQAGKIPSVCKDCGLYASLSSCMSKRELLNYKSKDGLYYLIGRKYN